MWYSRTSCDSIWAKRFNLGVSDLFLQNLTICGARPLAFFAQTVCMLTGKVSPADKRLLEIVWLCIKLAKKLNNSKQNNSRVGLGESVSDAVSPAHNTQRPMTVITPANACSGGRGRFGAAEAALTGDAITGGVNLWREPATKCIPAASKLVSLAKLRVKCFSTEK